VSAPLRVLYIHGLEGSPQGNKARYLRKYFEVVAEAMDTSDFEGCVRQQASLIERDQPDVVVGSSFGGAVAAALVQRGQWRGPTLLLAPALAHLGLSLTLPEGSRVLIVHGERDAVVSIDDSRELARNAQLELVARDDEHRLEGLLGSDDFAELVRRIS
jgi:predicted esterase